MRMIFHVPFELDPGSAFANDIRPLKMLEAFRSLGYEVDGVYGRNRERKVRAAAVRRKIQSGVEYNFVYSESAGLPTAFTDPSKKPTHPLFDLAFLRFCRANGLQVGLFYRDAYWRFPNTGQFKSEFRRTVLTGFYLFDLLAYNFAITKIYLPSMAMHRFIPLTSRIDAAALLFDSRVKCDKGETQTWKGSCAEIEMFASVDAAQRRAAYIQGILKAAPIPGNEYDYLNGNALLRIVGTVKPSVARQYNKAFGGTLQ